MNKTELKEIIRAIVREEVTATLPSVLAEIFSAKATSTRPVVSEQVVRPPVQARQRPVELKKFSSNPILNDILNQTSGGIPSETDGVSANLSLIGEGIATPATAEEIGDDAGIAAVQLAMTRDYRSLLKAADQKAKTSRPA